jgi:type II secretory pathway pseudopilin PulG
LMPLSPPLARPFPPPGSSHGASTTGAGPGAGTGARSRSVDQGHSLIESLVALALLGLVVAPMLAAVQVSLATSAHTVRLAQIEAVASDAAARLIAASLSGCPGPQHRNIAQSAALDVGWPATNVSFTAVARAELSGLAGAPGTTDEWRWVAEASCDGSTSSSVRRVDVRVASPDHTISTTVQVVLVPADHPGPTELSSSDP